MRRNLLLTFIVICSNLLAQIRVNGYAKVTGIAGSVLTVNNVNETNDTFEDGEYVIVMQMQDDVIGANTADNVNFGNLSAIANAGRYEVARISTHTEVASLPNTITLANPLIYTYNTGANSSVQIITFPTLGSPNYTTVNNITGVAWNGNIGGVVTFSVGGILTLGHNIFADALGFRGGARSVNYYDGTTNCINNPFRANNSNHAAKGEGIYKASVTTYSNCRGKILNGGGGGNHINGGGGGGGNFTAGGAGGTGWNGTGTGCSAANSVGGIGGLSLSGSINVNRIFMGGGGGGGQQNNSVGSAGGNGGGIILIKANEIRTTGTCNVRISANGAAAANVGNDGSGGGGAGGTIVLQVPTFSVVSTCSLNINSNGGNGGNVNSSTHSGGGGGGQGAIFFSIPQPTLNINSTTLNGNGGCNQNPCSTFAGNGTGTNNSGIFIDISGILPIELISFEVVNMEKRVNLAWMTASEKNTNYFYIERSTDTETWSEIGKVKAAENSSTNLYYEFDDHEPLAGVAYYRLKTVDLDNSYEYSEIKVVDRVIKEDFVVFFPNPTTGLLKMASSFDVSKISVNVTDVTGKQVEVGLQIESESKAILDLTGLSKGLYFITVKTSDGNVLNSNKIILK